MNTGRHPLKLEKLNILALILFLSEGKGFESQFTPASAQQPTRIHEGTAYIHETEESFWEGSGMTSWPTSPRHEDAYDLTGNVRHTYTSSIYESYGTPAPLPVTYFTISPTPSRNHVGQPSVIGTAIQSDPLLYNEGLTTSHVDLSLVSDVTLTPPIPSNIPTATMYNDINTNNDLKSLEPYTRSFDEFSVTAMSSSVDLKTVRTEPDGSSTVYNETSSNIVSSQMLLPSDGLLINTAPTFTFSVNDSAFASLFILPVTSSIIPTPVFPFTYSSSTFTSISDLPLFTDYSSPSSVVTYPSDPNRGRFLIVFKSRDCPEVKSRNSDSTFAKWLSSLGLLNASAEISKSKCHTQLTINITVSGPSSVIRRFDNVIKSNLTITILNRTFQVIEIQRLNPDVSDQVLNSTSKGITVISKNEFNAYIAVGVSFGLVLIVCISVCCMKCCAKRPNKRLDGLRSSHMPLRPEDYTLTPIPRPSSLYIDYYRGSLAGDLYSTTSAGSVASTSPTAEKGVVQPFDTSIVPLEDSSVAVISDVSRRDSVESVPPDLQTFNIHKVTSQGLIYSNATANSREKLHPRHAKPVDQNVSGVANPTFQRY